MKNIDKVIDAFITGDYFIIFLVLTLIILIVLILALIKSREDYNELISLEDKKDIINIDDKSQKDNDILEDLESLMAKNEDDIIDENKPLIKQVDIKKTKTYDDIIDEYEFNEEQNAVISAEELERKTKERMDALGETDNHAVIAKYEEDQEKKAIISYEQLLKNASNISLTYKDENKGKDAPKVQKIEIEEKEVTESEIYLEEEEFLRILKEFRVSIE